MGYQIQDRLEVSLFINNAEYPLSLGENRLNFLHMGSASKFMLPTIHVSVTDVRHTLDTLNLQDGIKLRVLIKAKQGNFKVYKFRKFNHKRVFNGKCYVYNFDGYLDYPKFWLGTALTGYRDTSNNVLEQIANECKMPYNGTSTADSQLWMQRNRKFCQFARSIEENAYRTDSSFMKWAVQFDGTLQYVDLNEMPPQGIKVVAYERLADGYTAVDYRPITQSGTVNAINGYANERQEQSAISLTPAPTNSQIKIQSDARSPMVNLAVKDLQGRGSVTYGPLNFGNVHEAYERAYYQNQRYASLFSVDVEFLIDMPTDFTIFEGINFVANSEKSTQDTAYSGQYTVSAMAIYIQGMNYFEKIVGTRMGTNLNYVSG